MPTVQNVGCRVVKNVKQGKQIREVRCSAGHARAGSGSGNLHRARCLGSRVAEGGRLACQGQIGVFVLQL
jgi:hypothetical protein